MSLAGSALWYANAGIPIFPCRPRDKRPATAHGLKDATTDTDQIRAWWTTNPDYNIGAPTGIRFDAIDIDTPIDVETLARFYDNAATIAIAEIATPSGGWHMWMPVNGQGNHAGLLGGHIDYRGKGGYVIVPPSLGPDGNRYTFAEPPRLERLS